MHLYTDVDAFPDQIDLIDDADPPNATNTNTAPEGLANRTRYLFTRLSAQAGLVAPSGLTAITGMAAGDTRYIPGFGFYVYSPTPVVTTVDGLQSVAGSVAGSQWLLADYDTRTPLLWDKKQVTYVGSAITLSGSFDTTDPIARNAGNVGREVCGGATLTVHAGDILHISYSVLLNLLVGTQSDVVTGVRYDAATYIADSIDNGAQVTAGASPWATSNHGVLYSGLASGNDMRAQISRSFYWVATVTGSKTFQLDAACDAQPHGSILQGSQLSILQYRPAGG